MVYGRAAACACCDGQPSTVSDAPGCCIHVDSTFSESTFSTEGCLHLSPFVQASSQAVEIAGTGNDLGHCQAHQFANVHDACKLPQPALACGASDDTVVLCDAGALGAVGIVEPSITLDLQAHCKNERYRATL